MSTYAGLLLNFEHAQGLLSNCNTVVLDAIAAGRRVVTNVDGINEDRIHDYLELKRKVDPAKLGQVVHIKNDDVKKPGFFFDSEHPDVDTIVRPGDLVAIDEAWRFWGADGGKLSPEHMQFFRMHRHYVHAESGVACDVVLMTQDITGLHRALRNVIEFSFRMVKLKKLGRPTNYRVEIYEGSKQQAKYQHGYRIKKYDPEIFPLYQSYESNGEAKEETVDKRHSIWANASLWWYVAGVVLMFGVGLFFSVRFFTHRKAVAVQQASAGQAGQAAGPTLPPSGSTGSAKPAWSEVWRIVGDYQVGEVRWVVLANEAGRLRVESPSQFAGSGLALIGDLDGERVTRWTGPLAAKSQFDPMPVPEVKK